MGPVLQYQLAQLGKCSITIGFCRLIGDGCSCCCYIMCRRRFDAVSAIFSSMFPLDFDRALPIFNCGAVEALLQKWNRTMDKLDSVRGGAQAAQA